MTRMILCGAREEAGGGKGRGVGGFEANEWATHALVQARRAHDAREKITGLRFCGME